MVSNYSEDFIIEQPAISLFAEMKYSILNCFHETYGPNGTLGRETSSEVVLVSRLRPVLEHLNFNLPPEAISLAIEELISPRSAMNPVYANQDIYLLLKNGVKVSFRNQTGETVTEIVKVVDWQQPENNDFLLVSQFWVSGDLYKKRTDLVGFVNGLPLVFIELKASHKRLENAYRDNFRDYRNTIPQLFWYNAIVILSNGSESKLGTISSEWEHFAEWKKVNSEGEEGIVSLETIIRGTCDKHRLLDIVENFTLFSDAGGDLIKLVAKNHQFLGVNNAIAAVHQIKENQGRLGVFWHTQGSGKSYSMVFFSQKILRKIPGNWIFLIVTDRQELDDQIYKNFANAGAVTEERVQAESCEHLKQLLQEDHRNIFTLIHKFQTEKGGTYPVLSTRHDIIVITDEAHRSQYDTLAMNMRNALPHAAFIAFTGTPLIVGEEKTKEVFGDYISIYDFKQSVDDKATVPLYYENRIPELQLTNEDLDDEMQQLVETANLSEEQEQKLEREFSRQYHLITRDDRLEKIAEDLVAHFMGRGLLGKAMVISIDKITTVRMYDKVKKYWQKYLVQLQDTLKTCPETEKAAVTKKIKFMLETDMAVVVSPSQNEIEDFQKKGLNMAIHRQRMVKEDLETKFKKSDDPFRLVFVCAMWLTGFDVPSLNTIYLDKPMRNHTLMQTIARANRVFHDKTNGLIVDYVGVFRNLQKALAIYGSGSDGGTGEGETPVKDKKQLIVELQKAIAETVDFCKERGVEVEPIIKSQGFQCVKYIEDAAKHLVDKQVLEAVDDSIEKIIINDELKKRYIALSNRVIKLYKAILPDPSANEFAPYKTLFVILAEKIKSFLPPADITHVMQEVEKLLDESIATEGYVIRDPNESYGIVDLSEIDFEKLRRYFEKTNRKRTEAEKLRSAISKKIQQMVQLNKTRINFIEKFQKLIDEYNSGSINVELFFTRLVAFVQELNEEDKRGIVEQLSEEELALCDILTKPDMNLSEKEKNEVKKTAKDLLASLKQGKLVLDWRKKLQARAQVLLTIQEILDQELPRNYTPELYQQKCQVVYQHIYDSYFGMGQSIYNIAS